MKNRATYLFLLLTALTGCSIDSADHERAAELAVEIYETCDHVGDSTYVQRPEETIAAGSGDCFDLSVLLARRMIDEGIRPIKFVVYDNTLSDARHVNVEFDGERYDPTVSTGRWEYWDRYVEVERYTWSRMVYYWLFEAEEEES